MTKYEGRAMDLNGNVGAMREHYIDRVSYYAALPVYNEDKKRFEDVNLEILAERTRRGSSEWTISCDIGYAAKAVVSLCDYHMPAREVDVDVGFADRVLGTKESVDALREAIMDDVHHGKGSVDAA